MRISGDLDSHASGGGDGDRRIIGVDGGHRHRAAGKLPFIREERAVITLHGNITAKGMIHPIAINVRKTGQFQSTNIVCQNGDITLVGLIPIERTAARNGNIRFIKVCQIKVRKAGIEQIIELLQGEQNIVLRGEAVKSTVHILNEQIEELAQDGVAIILQIAHVVHGLNSARQQGIGGVDSINDGGIIQGEVEVVVDKGIVIGDAAIYDNEVIVVGNGAVGVGNVDITTRRANSTNIAFIDNLQFSQGRRRKKIHVELKRLSNLASSTDKIPICSPLPAPTRIIGVKIISRSNNISTEIRSPIVGRQESNQIGHTLIGYFGKISLSDRSRRASRDTSPDFWSRRTDDASTDIDTRKLSDISKVVRPPCFKESNIIGIGGNTNRQKNKKNSKKNCNTLHVYKITVL